jgi:hypothetical protein
MLTCISGRGAEFILFYMGSVTPYSVCKHSSKTVFFFILTVPRQGLGTKGPFRCWKILKPFIPSTSWVSRVSLYFGTMNLLNSTESDCSTGAGCTAIWTQLFDTWRLIVQFVHHRKHYKDQSDFAAYELSFLSRYGDEATFWTTKESEFDSLEWKEIFSFRHTIHACSGAHQASCLMCTGDVSSEVKRPGREADHSHPSSATWLITSGAVLHSPYVLTAWGLIKYKD